MNNPFHHLFAFNNVLKIFETINNVLQQINKKQKRLISIKYIIHCLFLECGIDFEIKITKCKKSSHDYEKYWNKLLKTDL